jgi:hypothetical protein
MYPVQVDIGLIGIVVLVVAMSFVKLLIMDPQELDHIPGRKWVRGEYGMPTRGFKPEVRELEDV